MFRIGKDKGVSTISIIQNLKILAFPFVAALLISVVAYLILNKHNENYQFAIDSYQSEILKYQNKQGWIDDLVKLRKEFVNLDMYLEESITINDRFLSLLDSIISNLSSDIGFRELEINNEIAQLTVGVNSRKQLTDYCRALRRLEFSCSFSKLEKNNFKIEVAFGEIQ
ncbi:MAG: hypothetical protein KUG78_02460 [Kangiellaceae bacterium]|nr:hypothetical protein [Kangiellaceae bacterium]